MTSKLKCLSLNVNGIRDYHKRKDVFDYLRGKNAHIIMLQETHLKTQEENIVRAMWGYDCILNGESTNSNGVGIFFNTNFQYKIHKVTRDLEGKYIVLDIDIHGKRYTIINLYGPSDRDCPLFFHDILDKLEDMNNESIIIGGDWNVIPDMGLDTHIYRGGNRPRARAKIKEMTEIMKLTDIWRELHPNDKKFTWRRFNSAQQGRLDYFIISENLLQNIALAEIEPGYRTDHSITTLEINLGNINQRTRTYWKFNNSLLKDAKYIEETKTIINKVKSQYCALVYNIEQLDSIDSETLELQINDALFFDTLLMEIRGKTIAYSSYKKKQSDIIEKRLLSEIEELEQKQNIDDTFELLELKKEELQSLRKKKIDGMIIRSKTQWSIDGERNSKYFCNLEKRHYTDKAFSTLERSDGEITNDPKVIKEEVLNFYEHLYKSREQGAVDTDPIADLRGPSLSQTDRDKTEGRITIEEAGRALRKMKNGKSPGLDGFTTEFFKFFWKDLGAFFVRSINYGFQMGEMSITQRRGVITCIPKENKPKRLIKNWRPITLLNTTYKIASACIAERIKSILPKIIGEEQKGFLAGRYIGENIRMLYDILSYTDTHNLPGMVMLIDFEKAFDSISWSFIKRTLDFFKFGPDIKRWINIFYEGITACVSINGSYTRWFQIQRGVRQGDPLSPYLYLISAEILSLIIKKHQEIKGIKLADNVEALISQFADDTALYLDGSQKCFEACISCLENFTKLSGLKMNFEKTQIVWIGSQKNSNVRYMRDKNFIWNPGIFKMLGISFSVNVKNIVPLNYENKLKEIDVLLKIWSRRHLTPFGKITVIKSMAMAKIVHLFINLPDPGKTFLNQLKKAFNNFLWDGKKAKINMDTACAEYHEGGLKMTNVDAFLAALKIKWLKRLEETTDNSFMKKSVKLMNERLLDLSKTGGELSYILMNDLLDKNLFWFDVVKHYRRAYSLCKANTDNEFLSECIQFNTHVKKGNKHFYLENWLSQGIRKIGDLLDDNGFFFTFDEFKLHYPGLQTDRKEFTQVLNSVKGYQNSRNIILNKNSKQGQYPKFWQTILSKDKKAIYNLIKQKPKKHMSLTKWENIFNDTIQWSKVFIQATRTTSDPKLKWFQIRMLYRIIPTNRFLHIRKIKDNPNCTFGCNEEETIVHLFYTCSKVYQFWNEVLDWVKNNCTNCDTLSFSEQLIIFGTKKNVITDKVIDLLIITGKWHIYKCKLQDREPRLDIFKQQFKERHIIEKSRYITRSAEDIFNNVWTPYRGLLT